MMGQSTYFEVIYQWESKNTYKIQDGNWEMITVLESISAGGISLALMVICKEHIKKS